MRESNRYLPQSLFAFSKDVTKDVTKHRTVGNVDCRVGVRTPSTWAMANACYEIYCSSTQHPKVNSTLLIII